MRKRIRAFIQRFIDRLLGEGVIDVSVPVSSFDKLYTKMPSGHRVRLER